GLSSTVVFAQIRSLVVDLLQVAGMKRISSIATLPPTVPHPAYEPDR
ncbi:aromatic acid exporter family protein, partial [Rhodococcus erythropolis]|nr:aromatic acid exporter family protein [Rhodococcus erythropolis]